MKIFRVIIGSGEMISRIVKFNKALNWIKIILLMAGV